MLLQGLLQQLLRLLAQRQVSLVAVWLAATMALVSAADLQGDLDLGVCPLSLIPWQLQVAYRCQPDEFFEATACGKVKKVIDCQKGRYLAVHSASRGRSRSSDCSITELTNEADCRVHCVIREVKTMCMGRHRCSLSANDDRFGQRCPLDATAQPKPNVLRIRYTCVRRVVLEELKHDNGTSQMNDPKDYLCSEDGNSAPPVNVRRRGQVTPVPTSSNILDPSSTSIAQESKQTNRWNAIKTRESFVSTPAATSTTPSEANMATPEFQDTDSSDGVHGDSVSLMEPRENSSESPPSVLLRSMSEWLWTWTYVRDNVEKSVLYLLCSICFGIIVLLIAVIINLACLRRKTRSVKLTDDNPVRVANSDNSVKWRSPESESSTGDDRTFQGDEDVEATHGVHHHHNHHPRQGYSFHRGGNNPSSPSAPVNPESSPDDLDGTEGTALMKPRNVSDDETLPPQPQGTQSLPRRTAPPHLWYSQDAGDESPVAATAQTLQPTRHYNR